MKTQFYILLLILFACSCSKEEDNKPIDTKAERTIIIYMAADNNLYRNAEKDIKEILTNTIPPNINVLIYYDVPSWISKPKLIKVENNGISKVVKEYEYQNSVSESVVESILSDIIATYQAKSYGLIFWSHGTGWLPKNYVLSAKTSYSSLVKSFGRDDGREINIKELAKALPIKFDFLIFDACFMGSIEVLYELKDKAEFIISSPTEILVTGFPYDKILKYLFISKPDYKGVALSYMNYYENQTEGESRSATISVVNTEFLSEYTQKLNKILSNSVINKNNIDDIQRYDSFKEPVFVDLKKYLDGFLKTEDRQVINQTLKKLIVYNGYTEYFLNIKINESCGLSIYMPNKNKQLNKEYQSLKWYNDSRISNIWQ